LVFVITLIIQSLISFVAIMIPQVIYSILSQRLSLICLLSWWLFCLGES